VERRNTLDALGGLIPPRASPPCDPLINTGLYAAMVCTVCDQRAGRGVGFGHWERYRRSGEKMAPRIPDRGGVVAPDPRPDSFMATFFHILMIRGSSLTWAHRWRKLWYARSW